MGFSHLNRGLKLDTFNHLHLKFHLTLSVETFYQCTSIICSKSDGRYVINDFVFLSWHAAKSFIKYLTMESFIPTSMLSINKMDYVARRNIECFLKFQMFALIQILGVNFPRHLVRFSHAFPLDSFSRTARTRSHVQC